MAPVFSVVVVWGCCGSRGTESPWAVLPAFFYGFYFWSHLSGFRNLIYRAYIFKKARCSMARKLELKVRSYLWAHRHLAERANPLLLFL